MEAAAPDPAPPAFDHQQQQHHHHPVGYRHQRQSSGVSLPPLPPGRGPTWLLTGSLLEEAPALLQVSCDGGGGTTQQSPVPATRLQGQCVCVCVWLSSKMAAQV
jgi:hypothetical protein